MGSCAETRRACTAETAQAQQPARLPPWQLAAGAATRATARTGTAVGGTGVSVGGTGVKVAVGIGVSVGVAVGVKVGVGIGVSVGHGV